MNKLKNLKIGYWPNTYEGDAPGDRRRFIFYADKTNILFEYYNSQSSYDIVILTQAADFGIVNLLKQKNTKIIFECIDSYYIDSFSWKDIFRGVAKFTTRSTKSLFLNYRNKLREILKDVDAISCASIEQKNKLLEYNTNVHWIPDMINNEIFKIKNNYSNNEIINIVWEGLGSNVYQLNILKDVLNEFSKSHEFKLNVITDLYFNKHLNSFGRTSTEKILSNLCEDICIKKWHKDTYAKLITECDIAIIPIDNTSKLALGKPENKLILFWKMGMPTLTSSTVSYSRVMKDSKIHLGCNNDNEWLKNLNNLASNQELRKNIAIKGKDYAQKNYSEIIVLEKWDNLFKSIL